MFESVQIAAIKRAARKRLGKLIKPLETMAAHPKLLIAWTKFNLAWNKFDLVDAKLKALAVVRTAKLVECPF